MMPGATFHAAARSSPMMSRVYDLPRYLNGRVRRKVWAMRSTRILSSGEDRTCKPAPALQAVRASMRERTTTGARRVTRRPFSGGRTLQSRDQGPQSSSSLPAKVIIRRRDDPQRGSSPIGLSKGIMHEGTGRSKRFLDRRPLGLISVEGLEPREDSIYVVPAC